MSIELEWELIRTCYSNTNDRAIRSFSDKEYHEKLCTTFFIYIMFTQFFIHGYNKFVSYSIEYNFVDCSFKFKHFFLFLFPFFSLHDVFLVILFPSSIFSCGFFVYIFVRQFKFCKCWNEFSSFTCLYEHNIGLFFSLIKSDIFQYIMFPAHASS